jgi:hypothetical protein
MSGTLATAIKMPIAIAKHRSLAEIHRALLTLLKRERMRKKLKVVYVDRHQPEVMSTAWDREHSSLIGKERSRPALTIVGRE